MQLRAPPTVNQAVKRQTSATPYNCGLTLSKSRLRVTGVRPAVIDYLEGQNSADAPPARNEAGV